MPGAFYAPINQRNWWAVPYIDILSHAGAADKYRPDQAGAARVGRLESRGGLGEPPAGRPPGGRRHGAKIKAGGEVILSRKVWCQGAVAVIFSLTPIL